MYRCRTHEEPWLDVPSLLLLLHVMQSINLSGCNLHGSLPANLTQLVNLRYLNISLNPGLLGSLPENWAAMSSLEVLDVSGCSVTGMLPSQYAALQQLREFNASGNRGITGGLPSSWGLMQSLQVSVTQSEWHGVKAAHAKACCMVYFSAYVCITYGSGCQKQILM